VVIHVLELGPEMKTLGEKSRAKLAALPERVRKKLAEIVSTLGAPYGTRTVVAEGKPPEILLEEATRLGSDLLIVGKQGNTLFDRITVGSTSSAVMRGAHLPVVLVPGYRVRSVSRS
jgi:nucleotide-binding universal stress UspA family protein